MHEEVDRKRKIQRIYTCKEEEWIATWWSRERERRLLQFYAAEEECTPIQTWAKTEKIKMTQRVDTTRRRLTVMRFRSARLRQATVKIEYCTTS
jgi:hypothetical protein